MDAKTALTPLARAAATFAAGAALLVATPASGAQVVDAAGAGTTSAQSTPSDSGYSEQWDLLNTGQFSGTAGDDISASSAWEIEPGGNAAVTVGLVDSGVDFEQPSLAHTNLYTQTSGGSSTRACASASYGCSFVGAGGTPSDDNGHGTATAGEIFSGWDGGTYAGVAPESTLIVAKVLDGANQGTTMEEAEGLDYVADHGARVVNVSVAGAQSSAVHEAIAGHPETLFVAAAGNAGADDDSSESASYPCADPSPNVICVAASDTNDRLASFSNYGASTVDLAAPGVRIGTLTREGSSDAYSGTSFAAPLVTGVAALAFAVRPKATVAQVKQAILESVDTRAALSGKTVTGGRLNAHRTLTDLIAISPAAPPVSSSAPSVFGTSAVGGELAASAGAWSGDPASTTISWERCDSAGGHCQLIAGAGGPRYAPTDADNGYTLRAEVLATSAAGSEIAFSAPTALVGARGSEQAAGVQAAASAPSSVPAGSSSAAPSPAASSPVAARTSSTVASLRGALVKPAGSVTLSARPISKRSRLVRLLLRSTAAKPIAVSVTTRIGARVSSTRLVLTRDISRALSIELPRGRAAARAYVLVSGPGLLLKRAVTIG